MYYHNDVAILKKYNDDYYRLCVLKKVRAEGQISKVPIAKFENGSPKALNEKKLDNNIVRAKSTIKEYALCNDFEYFVTLTINKEKYDRYNFKAYYKDLGKFINNYNTVHKTKIKYILVPEQHKDGAWHMHGLISGVLPKHLIENENGYLEWKQYSKKFGYISLGMIKDKNKVSSYITKYITKDLSNEVELGMNLYYCSKGLKKAEEIKRGTLIDNVPFDFENDFCKIKIFDNDLIKDIIE